MYILYNNFFFRFHVNFNFEYVLQCQLRLDGFLFWDIKKRNIFKQPYSYSILASRSFCNYVVNFYFAYNILKVVARGLEYYTLFFLVSTPLCVPNIFYSVSLTLEFGLLFEIFNPDDNFSIKIDRVLIFKRIFHVTRPFHEYHHYEYFL